MTVCIVPVKGLSTALSRLGSLLSQREKAVLSQTMLKDVLGVLGRVEGLDGVVVVTRDPAAEKIASEAGARVIEEPEAVVGEGPAVDYGAGVLAQEGVERVLVVPSDLPLVQPSEIEALLRIELGVPSVTMAPAHDGGTNALLRSPPTVIPSRFGPNSLSLHIGEAQFVVGRVDLA